MRVPSMTAPPLPPAGILQAMAASPPPASQHPTSRPGAPVASSSTPGPETAALEVEDADGAYVPAVVEAKWQARWAAEHANRTPVEAPAKPYYNLMMFPYPSAEGLHIGNVYAFTGADVHGRYQRFKGHTVFEPIGYDAFGIHSENYALKVGEHPATLVPRNIAHFREQLERLGAMFDWSKVVNTTDPEYYRWTQWIFLRLYNAGLAEHREGPVNWCPSCLTVLADEQVIDGECERCTTSVETRVLRQWFLAITRYSQQLLDALEDLDWSARTKTAQRNWIGRSVGAQLRFDLQGCERPAIEVFTTRPDTLFGATFLVVGADHPDLAGFTAPGQWDKVTAWQQQLPAKTNEPDFSVGISLGSTAVHPLTGDLLPVWAAPYVLGTYSTGAVMAVSAHDTRDHAFALAHDLPIVQVLETPNDAPPVGEAAWTGRSRLVASGPYTGMDSAAGGAAITAALAAQERGRASVQYRLRDWLISRQRYWGPPIPIIHCDACGTVPVPEDQLPVLLPEVDDFRPLGTGRSPLASATDWVNVACPQCGIGARRETDVSDNFLDSAWYYLRYPSADLHDRPFDAERTRTWMPVDSYIGGNEHAVLHLMYARFINRVLYDLGDVPEPEPFHRFRAHGMIVKDGAKMSKSRGNVVNPDTYFDRYGADTLRLYLLFMGPYTEGGDFRDEGITGITRFLERVWRAVPRGGGQVAPATDEQRRLRRRHRLLAEVDERYGQLAFNTAIALLMEFSREVDREATEGVGDPADARLLLQLLAPLAPHLTEELWERLGEGGSVHDAAWPEVDPSLLVRETVTVAVTVNGKPRAMLQVSPGTASDVLEGLALAEERVQHAMAGRQPKRIITVADRIVNIVV